MSAEKAGASNGEYEDDDDDEEDEFDDHGSNVVATLCRKVSQQTDKANLVIAVVVSSRGYRDDAKKCADRHIKKLIKEEGEDKKTLTCAIITGVNKPKPQVKEQGEGEGEEDGDEGQGVNKEGIGDHDAEEEDNRVDYTPSHFLGDVYNKGTGTKTLGYPLGGGVTSHRKEDVKGLLRANYEELLADKKKEPKFKSTWLVLHKTAGINASNTEYNNNENKVVVVVLSKRFFYPLKSGRITLERPILVCNVPYGNAKDISILSGRYEDIFHQIGAFLARYNSQADANTNKIDLIAISYPKSLLNNKISKKPVTRIKAAKKKKQPIQRQTAKAKKAEDEDSDDESVDGEEDQGEEDDTGSDDSEEYKDIWLKALDKCRGDTAFQGIKIKLMYEEHSGVWGAPGEVKYYFDDADGLLKKFPYCINNGESEVDQTVNLDGLKTTMFVCDLEPGKRVGNGNDGGTTGGCFGEWVPMHYTAAYIDKKHDSKYTEASAKEIASLIEVVTMDDPLHNASETTETEADVPTDATKIHTSKLETSAEERRKLVETMTKIYFVGYGPPEWVGEKYVDNGHFDANAPKAKLFYDEGAELDEVKKVAKEREPVNMGMDREFDPKLMKMAFGYSKSYYQRYYEQTSELAPNIGVLTYSLIRVPTKTNGHTDRAMNIYHAIGAALDHEDQPDYKFFVEWAGDGGPRDRDLINFYVSVFMKILSAAQYCKAKGIVMSLVGADAYASKYPYGKKKMQTNVWIPAFKFVLEHWSREFWPDIKEKKVFALLCDPQKSQEDPAYKYMTEDLGAYSVGKFPDFLSDKYEEYKDWMIVNAWDCHTIPGNGNERDDTLDGFIGRISEIQYLGWGEANQHLLKKPARVYVPWYSDDKESDADSNKQSSQSGPAANTRSTKTKVKKKLVNKS